MTSDADRICPVCGQPLASDAPQGLCPECLMKSGFETRMGNDPSADKSGSAPPSVARLAGLFPQLEIIGLAGQGGMGAVYRARQARLNRFVALKILLPAKQDDPQFVERFEREAGTLASLNHPNIVTVYEFGETQGLYYLLMEFVPGLTLRQVLLQRRLTLAEVLALVPQICQALQYAHDRRIVHRDIKPENILFDSGNHVKISDFGVAKLLDPEPEKISLTSAQHVVGTPHYMAPEQIENPKLVDHRADIYSFGVVFYEMLTGELPIGKFQTPSQKAHLDVRLDEVVLHTLEKEPERRYQNISHVKTDVETIAMSPGKKPPFTSPRRQPAGAKTWSLKKAAVTGVLGFIALALLIGLVALLLPGRRRSAGALREGLVALWSGEKDARDSIGTNDGQLVNVTFVRGIAGRAFHLNGSNAFVQIPDSPALKPTDITVRAWVKLDALESPRANRPGLQTIVFKTNTRNPHQGYFEGYTLYKNTNQFTFTIASADGRQVFAHSLTVPRVGVWYYVAGTYNSFNTNVEIYVNGVLEGSAHADFPLDCGTRPLFIGTTGEWWVSNLQGTVDEVALYNRALTVNEIHDDYESIRSKNPKLVEPARTGSATDSARSNTSQTIENDLSVVASRSLVARWSAAENGKDSAGTNDALLEHVTFAEMEAGRTFIFNGTNASIRIPASPSLNVGLGDGFTVTAWVKPESSTLMSIWEWNQNNGIRSGTKQTGPHAEIYGVRHENALYGGVVDTDGITHGIRTTNGVIRLNRFQHVALTYDKASGIAALYRNGSVVARMNLGSFTPQTSFDFFIGNRPSGFFTGMYFQGQIDEIAMYNRALTAAEIHAGYNAVRPRFLRNRVNAPLALPGFANRQSHTGRRSKLSGNFSISMKYFNTPGTLPLYSGVTTCSPSDCRMASANGLKDLGFSA